MGGLPVFSRDWGMENGKPKPFDQVVMDIPIGSGPVQDRPGALRQGHHLRARPAATGRATCNVRRGSANFDRITVKIYKDNTARLEALKAGEFDMMTLLLRRRLGAPGERQASSRPASWSSATSSTSSRPGFQSYVLNTRRPQLQDLRVREALGLALDYEWMNRQMFYNGYRA